MQFSAAATVAVRTPPVLNCIVSPRSSGAWHTASGASDSGPRDSILNSSLAGFWAGFLFVQVAAQVLFQPFYEVWRAQWPPRALMTTHGC